MSQQVVLSSSEKIIQSSERSTLSSGADGDQETLIRLRRLSKTIFSKKKRGEFVEKKLCRTNAVRYLDKHLTDSSPRVRYLALELLCCTIPRLGNRTDRLLKPLMSKIVRILGAHEGKEMKLKALHFLRAHFRHTNNMASFVDDFLHFGIGNADSTIRMTCYLGLSIIFDQNIGDNLFSRIIIPVANELNRNSSSVLKLSAFRALKRIHEIMRSDRFFEILNHVYPEAKEVYLYLRENEESDPFLSLVLADCTTVVGAYQTKRRKAGFCKDFGITEPMYLDRIAKTRECKRAAAVASFTFEVKHSYWSDANLECHLLDLLKFINCLLTERNKPVQLSGYDILKEVISRMGFHLAPDLRTIVGMLRIGLISPNPKIQEKAQKILLKLMQNVHPMTVIWELMNNKKPHQNEAVFYFVASMLDRIHYYELDMTALCKTIGYSLEDGDKRIQVASAACLRALMAKMESCPINGIKAEALRILLQNFHLRKETLQLIGIVGDSIEEYSEESESSEDEITFSEEPTSDEPVETTTTDASYPETPNTPDPTESNVWRYSIQNIPDVAPKRQIDNELLACFKTLVHRKAMREYKTKSENNLTREPDVQATSSQTTLVKRLTFVINRENRAQKNSEQNLLPSTATSDSSLSDSRLKKELVLTSIPRKCWNAQMSHNMNAGDDNCEEDFTIYERNESEEELDNFMEEASESYRSSAVEVISLNPEKYNFNIMQVEQPNPMEYIGAMTDEENTENEKHSEKCINMFKNDDNVVNYASEDREEIPAVPAVEESPIKTRKKRSKFTISSDKSKPKTWGEMAKKAMRNHPEAHNANDVHSYGLESGDANFNLEKIPGNIPTATIGSGDGLETYENADETQEHTDLQETDTLEDINYNYPLPEAYRDEEAPFLPKSRQLPRTPVTVVQQNANAWSSAENTKPAENAKSTEVENKETAKSALGGTKGNTKKVTKPGTFKSGALRGGSEDRKKEFLSPAKWSNECQWRRDLEYASKAGACPWAAQFEKAANSTGPFPSSEEAETAMKEALDAIDGKNWTLKEDAMLTLIRVARHHPKIFYLSANKAIFVICNEINSFRQSVAGKAILSAGYLFSLGGKTLENKLKLVFQALLTKSGNRTLAAYFRLVIQTLSRIANAFQPKPAAMAFLNEGVKHPNRAARETAAQFLAILTDKLGPINSLAGNLGSSMIKGASTFLSDSSAITRYCGKRMFQVFMKHPEFNKLKDQHLDMDTIYSLEKILEQIKTKGVKAEVCPINLIQ